VTETETGRAAVRGVALGVVALVVALALMVLPAILAIADSAVLSTRHDGGWLGSPIDRFATVQALGMIVPFALGALAVARRRGRDYGVLAALVALLGNFLLLRVVLAMLVRTVLV
jgi:hypothetical protein